MNRVSTVVTKDLTVRVRPTDFGISKTSGFTIKRTDSGNWSIRTNGGAKRTQSDGRLEFSVSTDMGVGPYQYVAFDWYKRGDSVILKRV